MTFKLFTFLTLLFCTTVGMAQPLPGSPLPDTITYSSGWANILSVNSRAIFTYNDQRQKQKVSIESWDKDQNKFVHQRDSIFTYNSEGKISNIKVGTSTFYNNFDYYYNKNKKDSIRIYKSGNEVLQRIKYEYSGQGFLTAIKDDTRRSNQLKPIRYQYFQHDQKGNVTTHLIDFYNNDTGILQNQYEYAFEYYPDNKIKFDTYRAKNINIDTNWSWQHRFEHIYLDNDEKVDVKQRYGYFPNLGWQVIAKLGFYYSEFEYKEVYGIEQPFPSSQRTIKYNSKRQEVSNLFENKMNGFDRFKPMSQTIHTYRNDGSIANIKSYTAADLNAQDTITFLIREDVYSYKIPDISSNTELYSGDDLSIFPNPAAQTIHICEPDNNIQSIRIIDVKGRVLDQKNINSDQATLERNGMPAGLYYLQLQTEKGTFTKPIIWVD